MSTTDSSNATLTSNTNADTTEAVNFRSDHALPREPLVVIQAQRSFSLLKLRDIWAYRELLYFLTWRDVKVRYKQTALGAAWAILQPLFMMVIFTIFFGRLAGVDSSGIPYPLYAFAGLVPWTFFSNALTAASNSLVGSANLITKVYFPRLIVPAAALLAGLVDFMLAFVLLVVMMIYYRVTPVSYTHLRAHETPEHLVC